MWEGIITTDWNENWKASDSIFSDSYCLEIILSLKYFFPIGILLHERDNVITLKHIFCFPFSRSVRNHWTHTQSKVWEMSNSPPYSYILCSCVSKCIYCEWLKTYILLLMNDLRKWFISLKEKSLHIVESHESLMPLMWPRSFQGQFSSPTSTFFP